MASFTTKQQHMIIKAATSRAKSIHSWDGLKQEMSGSNMNKKLKAWTATEDGQAIVCKVPYYNIVTIQISQKKLATKSKMSAL